MKILLVEDEEYRIIKFKENFIGCSLDITKEPQEAIDWLSNKDYDWIFLDHDLSPNSYEAYKTGQLLESGTGYDVAKYLEANPHKSPNSKVVLHSLNPAGAERMRRACIKREVHVIPFNTLFARLIFNKI